MKNNHICMCVIITIVAGLILTILSEPFVDYVYPRNHGASREPHW